MFPSLFTRLYFLTVALFAAHVAGVGLLAPALIDYALPWALPPMHARVIGALYLAGMVLMLGALRHPVPVIWAMLPLAACWTGVLLVVSLLWLDDFDWDFWTVRFWWFAYLVFPLVGAWLALRHPCGPMGGPWPLSALALGLLAGLLLLAPGMAGQLWPWPLPPLVAQIYSGPLFGIALGLVLTARRAIPAERRLLSLALLVLVTGMLAASLLHLSLFRAISPASWIWFGALIFALGRAVRSLASRKEPS